MKNTLGAIHITTAAGLYKKVLGDDKKVYFLDERSDTKGDVYTSAGDVVNPDVVPLDMKIRLYQPTYRAYGKRLKGPQGMAGRRPTYAKRIQSPRKNGT